MNKEIYENNNILIEVRKHADESVDYWIQCGQAGLMLDQPDLLDLTEILNAACMEIWEKNGS
jgi:hypothetical protein